MMVNKPEDRPKVIVLSVLIVFCILYFFVMILPRLLHAGSQAPHPNQAAGTTPPPTPAVSAAPVPAGGPATGSPMTLAQRQIGSDADTDPSGGPYPSPTRDPFRPPTPPPSAMQPPVLQPPHATQVADVRPIKPAVLPSISLPPLGGPDSSSPKGPGGPAASAAPAPLPEVALKGVIPGNPAVAVLQMGTETLHKYPGELLAPDLRLSRVTDEGVVLKHGKQSITLDVGHSTKDASTSVPSENGITTVDEGSSAPAKQPSAKTSGPVTAKASSKRTVKVAHKPASREVASSLPSPRKPASKSPKHIVFYRAPRRKHYAFYIYRHGHFVRYRPSYGRHILYVRRHGRFVRYHLRHRRHPGAA